MERVKFHIVEIRALNPNEARWHPSADTLLRIRPLQRGASTIVAQALKSEKQMNGYTHISGSIWLNSNGVAERFTGKLSETEQHIYFLYAPPEYTAIPLHVGAPGRKKSRKEELDEVFDMLHRKRR